MIADASSKVDISVPSIDTITSPGSIPAAAAGATGSDAVHSVCVEPAGATHSDTVATVVVPCWMPMALKSTVKRKIANSRFITGPPSMMMMRL